MFGLLLYTVVCFGIALMLVCVRSLFTKVGTMGDKPVFFKLFAWWVILCIAPYGWVEWQTRQHGKEFATAVDQLADRGQIRGTPLYWKVRSFGTDRSTIFVVSKVVANWGGTHRNLYRAEMFKQNGKWKTDSIAAVNSDDGDEAGFTVPPYW